MISSVYLAYPIDQVGPAHLVYLFEQVEKFKGLVANQVSWVFDPGDAFRVNPNMGIDPGLAVINRAALNNAEALVAFLPQGVPSVGVPMEIDRARAQGKAVLVFTDVDSYMLQMPGVAISKGFDDAALLDGLTWLVEQEPNRGTPVFGELRFTGEEEFAPTQTYEDDAGYDLVTSTDFAIPGRTFADVPCGINVELPERVWGMITGRSSTLRKRGLLVHAGIIDTGYRGPLFAAAYNVGDETAQVRQGERIAQLILFSNTTTRYKPMRVDELGPSERGSNGFGSTGA